MFLPNGVTLRRTHNDADPAQSSRTLSEGDGRERNGRKEEARDNCDEPTGSSHRHPLDRFDHPGAGEPR